MIRVVLAVLVAVALVGVALPVVDDARADHADATARAQLDRVADAVASLRRQSDPVPRDLAGASRLRRLEVPDDAAGSTAVAALAIGGTVNGTVPRDGPRTDVLSYRLPGGRTRVTAVLGVDLRVRRGGTVSTDDAALVLADDARVVFRYVRHRGRPTVIVEPWRPGSRDESGATSDHA